MNFIFLLLTISWSADKLPHMGVRYTLFETSIYSAQQPHAATGKKLPPHSAVIPCVIMRDGKPFTGSRGQPMLGYTEVYREPSISQKPGPRFSELLEPLHQLHQQRKEQNARLDAAKSEFPINKPVENMNCPEKIDGVVDIGVLFPEKRPVTYLPAPLTATLNELGSSLQNKILETDCCKPEPSKISVESLVREFHNSAYCTHIELARGKRKHQLLENWKAFIDLKAKEQPSLKPQLEKAMQADIASRTALYESNPEEGCSGKGLCEKDIILLSIRNRAYDQRCKRKGGFRLYGCKKTGDIVGVATPEAQYNIWNENIADTTFITSCFLRNDVHPNANPISQLAWSEATIDKEKYQRQVLVFEETLKRSEKILFQKDISGLFKGSDVANLNRIQHYYHPGAMTKCYPQYENLYSINDGYAELNGVYFPIRKELAHVTPTKDGKHYTMERLISDTKQTIDPADDTLTFQGDYGDAKIPQHRFSKVQTNSKCTPYGVASGCNIKSPKYYRTTPGWLRTGYIPDVQCTGLTAKGQNCTDPSKNVDEVQIAGKCSRSFAPVAAVP